MPIQGTDDQENSLAELARTTRQINQNKINASHMKFFTCKTHAVLRVADVQKYRV